MLWIIYNFMRDKSWIMEQENIEKVFVLKFHINFSSQKKKNKSLQNRGIILLISFFISYILP